jgi:hypothetical protein
VATFADNVVPTTHAQVTDTPNDRYMIFTNTSNIGHTFTVPVGGLNCDILMIGGGGGGYGGGAGACIVAINQTLPAGSCVVNVGVGGVITPSGVNGSDSFIKVDNADRYRAKGGGYSPHTTNNSAGNAGGCGAGAGNNSDTTTENGGAAVQTNVVNGVIENTPPRITSTYAVMGNAGGNNGSAGDITGSGGGIGTAGVTGGVGGNGAYQVTLTGAATPINFRSYFANGSTTFGVQDGTTTNYYIGGGGAGFNYNNGGWKNGGLGGGGGNNNSFIAVANTGGGGAGGAIGASGIIIIRYRSGTITTTPTPVSTTITTLGTPSIELIRGTSGDNNLDYKLGNYEGNFKIMSSISNTDTDRLALTSGGNLMLTNNSTNSTALSIINSNVIVGSSNYTSNVITGSPFLADFSGAGNTAPSVHELVSGSTTERIMIFRTATSNHTFTVPSGGLNCDILMIGGGAGGNSGGGGGAGACIVAINQTLPAGSCVVNVGTGTTNNSGTNGGDSFITVGGIDRYRAKGGGITTGNSNTIGNAGGCGGGAGYNTDTTTEAGGAVLQTNVVNGVIENTPPRITSTYAVMGNAGGNNGSVSGITGSGGGIGTAGVNGGNQGGNGAYQVTLLGASTPINFRNYFANGSTSFGVQDGSTGNYYIGGGGGAFIGTFNSSANGGLGGGGGNGISTVANTGGGGGYLVTGGHGASGIIIIRYRSGTITTTPTPVSTTITTLGTPSIELIRGIAGDSNQDYKLGNYEGNFKIMSSISNTDTDRLAITSSGNLSLSNNSTNSTALSIINSNIVVGSVFPAITTDLATTGTVTKGVITSSTDRFMIFTAGSGTFTVPAGGINCDILMIGGGGAGGNGSGAGGGGGGAGACIVAINQTLPVGTYNVSVGAGDVASTNPTGAGGDSTITIGGITRYQAKGGGRGEFSNNGRNLGGCGGGSGSTAIKSGATALNTNIVSGIIVNANTLTSTYAVFGNKGGDKLDTTNANITAGGGGIGGAGGDHRASANNINAGPGGIGIYQTAIGGTVYNFRNYFANAGNSFGIQDGTTGNFYIGGGGGGSVSGFVSGTIGGSGGLGGGGTGGITGGFTAAVQPTSGSANTGGGGGGGISTGTAAGNGGSGIVIVRYRVSPPTVAVGVPSVELVRGVAGDSNHDYKIGNYDGNFKIISSVSGTADTERLNITSTGNVGIGTVSNNKLLLYDDTISNTTLTIQNNNLFNTVNTVQSTSNIAGAVFIVTFADSFVPSVHEPVTGTGDRIMIFKSTSDVPVFIVPSGGLNCDILMIGGGGGSYYGGGGAGACIVAINQTLTTGSYSVGVGSGGSTNSNGQDSYIYLQGTGQGTGYRYLATGGGYCPSTNNSSGNSGGCGGGANYNLDSTTEAGGSILGTNVVKGSYTGPTGDGTTGLGYVVLGNVGGNNGSGNGSSYSGGGGGIGGSGGNSDASGSAAAGGNGRHNVYIDGTIYNFRNWFANGGNNFGVQEGTSGNYYIGGGGRANSYGTNSLGWGVTANLGCGGVGNGMGSSGIIIIRYRSGTIDYKPLLTTTPTTTLGTPSIELIRGIAGDSNIDYRIDNMNGDFLVEKSVSGVDTDYLRINGISGAITNPLGTASFSVGSDRRIKEGIERASYEECYRNMGRLELRRFRYKEGYNVVNKDREQLGFIAQEVRDIFPKSISEREYKGLGGISIRDMLSIDITQINYTLYGAVRRLMEKGEEMDRRMERMERIGGGGGSGGGDVVNEVIEDTMSSNVIVSEVDGVDTMSSNVIVSEVDGVDTMSSNVIVSEVDGVDTMSSNVVVSEVIEDTMSSNVMVSEVIEDTISSNVVVSEVASMTSNVVIE